MNLHIPSLAKSTGNEAADRACAVAHGRQLARDEYKKNCSKASSADIFDFTAASYFALVAGRYAYAGLPSPARDQMLKGMSNHPATQSVATNAQRLYQDCDLGLDLRRREGDYPYAYWQRRMQDVAVGIAQRADELYQHETGNLGQGAASVQHFLSQWIALPSEVVRDAAPICAALAPAVNASATTIVAAKPTNAEAAASLSAAVSNTIGNAAPTSPSPVLLVPPPVATVSVMNREPLSTAAARTSDIVAVTAAESTTALVDAWLKQTGGQSASELSRRGSAVRLFLNATKLLAAPSDALASINQGAVRAFLTAARANPLATRGERARPKNVQSFLDHARATGIAIPSIDWNSAQTAITKGRVDG